MTEIDEYENDYMPPQQVGYGGDEQLMRWLLDSEDIITQLEHKLRGEVYNSKEETYEPKYNPLINEKGISTVMTVINSHLTKNFKTGILTEEQINKMCKSIRNGLIILFYQKHNEFEIDKSNLDLLLDILDNSILTHLNSSKNGETLRLLKEVTTINQTKIERNDNQNNGRSILSKLLRPR